MNDDASITLALAEAEIDTLCQRVGLTRSDGAPWATDIDPDAAAPPDGSALWTSGYAHLLLWPAGGYTGQSLEASAEAGEAWFDAWLLSIERSARGRTIDGYLVLALPSAPNEEEHEEVRRLELSAHVCRKHLIWPTAAVENEDASWSRLGDITMLGLPEAAAAPKAELAWPELDAEAAALWNDLVSLGQSATLQQDEA
jgi:hypothetical protein